MTLRAIIVGLVGVCIICGLGFFNDFVLKQTFMIGTYLPIPVFAGVLLTMLFLNPLLGRISGRGPLSAAELAVAIALMLFASFIPGRGLMHHATNAMIMPYHYAKTRLEWQATGAISKVPKKMMADTGNSRKTEDAVLGAFVQGMGKGSKHISPLDVPWRAWARPLLFWGSMIMTMVLALTGLALVVHRQWTRNEQVPYPIVTFARELLPEPGRAWGRVLYSRMFWIAAGAVLALHLNNYAAAWWPKDWITVPLQYDLTAFTRKMPIFSSVSWSVFCPRLLFSVIGFAYLLSTDVSLSMGIAPLVYSIFLTFQISRGAWAWHQFFDLENTERGIYGGAYLGLGLALLYTGRYFYINVFRRSLCLKTREEPPASAVWGARILLVAATLFILQLAGIGVDWQIATLYTVFFLLISLVLSRVVAETGAYFIHCWFYPCALLMTFLGGQALGPQTLAALIMVTVVLMIDPREIFMPFAVHALAMVERAGVRPGRPAMWGVAAVVLGLAVAVPATLYRQYDRGATAVGDGWSLGVMCWPFDTAASLTYRNDALYGQGTPLPEPRGWQRFAEARPDYDGVAAFCGAFALVLLFVALRARFSRFPLHPVMFLVLGSYQSRYMAASFFAGWLVKSCVQKLGGAAAFEKYKPLMLGLIAGEMFAGAFTMFVGAVYYLATNESPVCYVIIGA